MPRIPTELPLPGDEAIMLGVPYKIADVETFTSEVQGFKGYRVILEAPKGKQLAIPLWARDIAGLHSKLGAFITVLGNDTDTWPNKMIKFVKWAARDRQIELVK